MQFPPSTANLDPPVAFQRLIHSCSHTRDLVSIIVGDGKVRAVHEIRTRRVTVEGKQLVTLDDNVLDT